MKKSYSFSDPDHDHLHQQPEQLEVPQVSDPSTSVPCDPRTHTNSTYFTTTATTCISHYLFVGEREDDEEWRSGRKQKNVNYFNWNVWTFFSSTQPNLLTSTLPPFINSRPSVTRHLILYERRHDTVPITNNNDDLMTI